MVLSFLSRKEFRETPLFKAAQAVHYHLVMNDRKRAAEALKGVPTHLYPAIDFIRLTMFYKGISNVKEELSETD